MAIIKNVVPEKIIMGKLDHNSDLLDEITEICVSNDLSLGRIEALGAVKKALMGYYNQDSKEYQYFEINRHLEITSLIGNVSLKDGKPIVHAHITLADEQGNAFRGHLAQGTIVFACEIIIHSLNGPAFNRGYDEVTGLPLWDL